MKYDFSGWATRNNLRCSDGRTILKDAFKDNDGQTVPLVWNHNHSDPNNVLGHALLENREEGVYAYCTFNETESGQNAKLLVEHGDISALSICANELKHQASNVLHGMIREVSLVLAGANPGAFIDYVMEHGDDAEDEAIIYTGEELELNHSSEGENDDQNKETDVQAIFDSMSDEQKALMYCMGEAFLDQIGKKGEPENNNDDESKGGTDEMKHNIFDNEENKQTNALTHADEEAIIKLAKTKSVGSFREALTQYVNENETLSHGIDNIEELFPEHELMNPGAPEMITRDQSWVQHVLNRIHKSPISRVRMRWADVRKDTIRAMGYEKGTEKKLIDNLNLLNRTFDPQTVYVKDKLERDDIIDITDFNVVEYQQRVMRMALDEKLALAALIGDGLAEGSEGKIQESHIHSIWNDDELFTIHQDVDLAAAKAELQGTNTGANFGENYIYAEAIITAALYAREKYKGSGSLDFYCTPHLLNIMLLARDLNGRRIYTSKADLAAALDVNAIYTIEQFEQKTRKTDDNKTKKLLGLFVNMGDYRFGSTKGGQVTSFSDFDIDFNQEKYLMETRLSGALTKPFSAIALEEQIGTTTGD